MFNFKKSVTGNVQVEKVWGFYSDVSQWCVWDCEVESVILDGNFVSGINGTMKMNNGQSLPFALKDVQEPNNFVSICQLGPISICFGHSLIINVDGSCSITHEVTINGGDEKQMNGMGKGITAHIPESMEKLMELAAV